jgi:hypothetical protein
MVIEHIAMENMKEKQLVHSQIKSNSNSLYKTEFWLPKPTNSFSFFGYKYIEHPKSSTTKLLRVVE